MEVNLTISKIKLYKLWRFSSIEFLYTQELYRMLNKWLGKSVLSVFSGKKKKKSTQGSPPENLLGLLYARFLSFLYSALQILALLVPSNSYPCSQLSKTTELHVGLCFTPAAWKWLPGSKHYNHKARNSCFLSFQE